MCHDCPSVPRIEFLQGKTGCAVLRLYQDSLISSARPIGFLHCRPKPAFPPRTQVSSVRSEPPNSHIQA
jgi:hypothetical protein